MQNISDDLNQMKRSSCDIGFEEAGTKITLDDQLRENIQKWLFPPDTSINQNTACEAHRSGTAAWFLEGSIYNEWKMTGSLLWIHGNRMVFHRFPTHATDNLWFRSGIRQEYSLVGDTATNFC